MKLRGSVVAVGTALALLAGGCSSVETAPNRHTLQQPFDEMVPFWKDLGITGLKVTLVTISDHSVSCGPRHITNSDTSHATFCYRAEGEDTIFISDRSYESGEDYAGRKGISPEAMGAAVIGHELGHAVIAQAGLLVESGKGDKEELLADCLAGAAIAATSPELGAEAAAFFETIGSDNHGSDQERKAAFQNGFDNGVAGCDPALAIRLGIPAASK